MQQLLPIIRRQRRPLLPVDSPPAVASNVEPVNAVASLARTAKETKVESPRSEERKEETD